MHKGKASWQAGLCGILIGSLVALAPLSNAAAQSRYRPYPAVPSSQQEQEDQYAKLFTAAAALGIVVCLVTDCLGLGSSGGSSPSGSGSYGSARMQQEREQKAESAKQGDQGIGCFWGYTSTGTCIK